MREVVEVMERMVDVKSVSLARVSVPRSGEIKIDQRNTVTSVCVDKRNALR